MTAAATDRPAPAGSLYRGGESAQLLYMGPGATVLVDADLLSVARCGPDRWMVIAVVSAPHETFRLVPTPAGEPATSDTERSEHCRDAAAAPVSLRPCPPPGAQRPDRA